MKAVIAAAAGGPEVLRVVERPVPTPGPGEVLIRVAAAGVNRPDIMQRSGALPAPPETSDIFGLEVAGHVETVGEGVDSPTVGSPVMALVKSGGYAEAVAAKAGQCLRVPDGLDLVDAAVLPAVTITSALDARASCTASVPMPLAPPSISTRSPLERPPRSNRLCQMVKSPSGRTAASTSRGGS